MLVGIGIPPNIKTSKNTAIMAAIIRRITNRKITSATIAIRVIMRRESVDPWKGSISTTTHNITFEIREIMAKK
jgi:hypothetical protein